MNDSKLDSPAAIKPFLDGIDNIEFHVPKSERYAWIARTLKRTGYLQLGKKDKSVLREYLQKMTGYSWSQLKRLIAQYREHHWIGRVSSTRHQFPTRYSPAKISCYWLRQMKPIKL